MKALFDAAGLGSFPVSIVLIAPFEQHDEFPWEVGLC